jgi:sterol 3beta-glucosyltransferase
MAGRIPVKLVVATYGTEGDTRPLAALTRALIDAGHAAHLLADAATLGSAATLGVPATGLPGDFRGVIRASAELVGRGGGFSDTARTLAGLVNANSEAWLRAIVAAGEGCDAVILSGLASFVGLSAAEFFRVPAISAGLIPIAPTREFPSPFLPPALVPRWLNRASHRLVNRLLWRAFREATNMARATVCGLPARRELWEGHAMLFGVSPSLLPRPADWPTNALVSGQWLPPAADWSPPPALGEFLAAEEPPIYVGFGSMAGFERRSLLREMVAAIAGRRALFYPGWSCVTQADLPDNFLVVGDTPHTWLFPRTSLAIHHGGAGTTHSAARAGIPSVVVPFAGDQTFWADRLRRAGVAPPSVPAKDLRATTLSRAIMLAQDDRTRARAAALGAVMRAEDGLRTTVAAITEMKGE